MKNIVISSLAFLKTVSFYFLTFLLNFFVPKDKGIVVMTASKGVFYNGNAKVLFESLQRSGDLKAYYFVSNKELFNNLSKERENIIYHYSLKGIWLFLRARTVCITHGLTDFLGFSVSPFQNWINLGHGSGTKVLGYLKEKLSIQEQIWLFLGRKFFYIVPSDFSRYMFAARYGVRPNRIFVTGYPRTDLLYKNSSEKKEVLQKRILYAPTYRKGSITEIFPFRDGDVKKIKNILEEFNLELSIRFHPNNYQNSRANIANLLKSSDRILDKSPDVVSDPQDLLIGADILITDFSSISRDYLYLDRPMIFIMNEIDEAEFQVSPVREEFAFCGYQVRSYSELKEALSEILEGVDKYAMIRRFVRDFSYNYIDDRASFRVAELIKKLA